MGMWNVGVQGGDINATKQGIGREGHGEGAENYEKIVGIFDIRR
jgi:hypothetical protein